MNQATLPFGGVLELARAPRARHDDPESSRAAARRARAIQGDHGRAILLALDSAPAPINAHTIAALTARHRRGAELSQVQVARRMRELLELGLVVVDGDSDRGRCYRLAHGVTL